MPKRTRFILFLIAISPALEAREPDLSLSNDLFDGQQPVETQKAGRSTWFGIGYESRREHADRANFEDNALRGSVFSGSGGGFSSSGGGAAPAAAGGGGGGRR
jgi:hypothetical protein